MYVSNLQFYPVAAFSGPYYFPENPGGVVSTPICDASAGDFLFITGAPGLRLSFG